jgi:hypothetical protein
MTNELMRGYKYPEWQLGQRGSTGIGNGLGRLAWVHFGPADDLLCLVSALESSRSFPLLHVGPCRQFLSELDEAPCRARFNTFLTRSLEFFIFSDLVLGLLE